MGVVHEIPSMRDRQTRYRVLEQLSVNHGIRVEALAFALGMSRSGVDQLLRALSVDGCATRCSANLWYRTTKMLPEAPTSTTNVFYTQRDGDESRRFDFGPLMEAWSLYGGPNPAIAAARVMRASKVKAFRAR